MIYAFGLIGIIVVANLISSLVENLIDLSFEVYKQRRDRKSHEVPKVQ